MSDLVEDVCITVGSLISILRIGKIRSLNEGPQRELGEVNSARVVESLLYCLPLPNIIAGVGDNQEWLVLYGWTYIAAINAFVGNEFPLVSGCRRFSGLQFDELNVTHKYRIMDAILTIKLINRQDIALDDIYERYTMADSIKV